MYIEYITPQRVADPKFTKYCSKGGDYRPTWLVRTTDWEKVPGYEAVHGYHTLSYCWEQSGEVVRKDDEQVDIRDESGHCVTMRVKKQRNTSSKRRKKKMVSSYMTYEGVLQQVCKDFDIEYLWYDKICIDQTNKEEKHREIKQMHLIYSNARYTVALVPEIYLDDLDDFDRINMLTNFSQAKYMALAQMWKSLWWKRSWTLEEVMMSTRILVVGTNTHMWCLAKSEQGNALKEQDLLSTSLLGYREREMKSANEVLFYAHFRASTKKHDKIFALANIFADIVTIDFDYDSDVSTVAHTFYRELAKQDLSVMLFGSILDPNGEPRYSTTMGSYDLPSWTGVAGLHSSHPTADVATLDSDYTIDDDMILHIKCRSYTIQPSKYYDYGVFSDLERQYYAHLNTQKIISSMDDFDGDERAAHDWCHWRLRKTTSWAATHYWTPPYQSTFSLPILPLSLTEESVDECIIPAIVFSSPDPAITSDKSGEFSIIGFEYNYFFPVLKKSAGPTGTYKAIGAVLVQCFRFDQARPSPKDFLEEIFGNISNAPQDFFIT